MPKNIKKVVGSIALSNRAAIAEGVARHQGWNGSQFVRVALEQHYNHDAALNGIRGLNDNNNPTVVQVDAGLYGLAAFILERLLRGLEEDYRKETGRTDTRMEPDGIQVLAKDVTAIIRKIMSEK